MNLLSNLLASGLTKATMWSTEPCGIPIVSIIIRNNSVEYELSSPKKMIDRLRINPSNLDNKILFIWNLKYQYKKKGEEKPHLF